MFDGRPSKKLSRFIFKGAVVPLLVILCFLVQCTATGIHSHQDAPVSLSTDEIWPHQKSDLPPDPDVLFGRLPNGVRYILKENSTPADRVSMHLYIQSGSLLETENERGTAHFLEHMLFNGSTHFPPGEMVKYFQRIGMQFGPDANAHTGFSKTVYDILLPKGDRDSLSEALVVLNDYAQGALLLPDEVEREKKVVLAEMRSRDSSRFRTLKAVLNFEMPGLLMSQRMPIGKRSVIEKMDAQMLRQFYDAWYRPERMILVLVGDFNVKEAEQLIKTHFGNIAPRGPGRDLPGLGRMQHKGYKYFYLNEADAGATTVAIESVVQADAPDDTLEAQQKRLFQDLAVHILQKRLESILQEPGVPLTTASNGVGYFLRQVHYAEIRAACKPEHWQQVLNILDQTLRSALKYGFTATELFCAKGDFQALLKREAKKEMTRESKIIAREIMASITRWKVLQSPGQHLARIAPALKAVTLDQVNQALIDMWQTPNRIVLVTGNADLGSKDGSPHAQIEAAYLASRQQYLSPPVNKELAVFPYLPLPEVSGPVVQREQFDDLGVEKVVFANGFTLWLKPTRYEANQVMAVLCFGDGRFSEPAEQPGLAQWTEAVVNESGFGALDRITLEEALTGRWADMKLDVREDMFLLKGKSVTSELQLLLQLYYTAIKDPGYREMAYQKVYRQFEQQGQRLPNKVGGVMKLKGQRFLSGGDSRFGIPVWQELKNRTLDEIKQWYGEQLRQAPMELAVVGDFQPDDLIQWVAKYFGSLPKRESGFQSQTRPGPVFPSGQVLRLKAQTQIPNALVVVAYPTDDFWDISRTRRLAMTAELFTERLRKHVREALGAAYSPFAYNHSYRSFSGYGLLQIHVEVDPSQADAIVTEVQQIAKQLATSSSNSDEIRRILDPTLTHIKDLRQTNKYWLNSVLKGATRHPQQLEWARTFIKDYAAITSEELRALSLKYLDNEKGATIVITPAGAPEK